MKKLLLLIAVLFGSLVMASEIDASEALRDVNELIKNGNIMGLRTYLARQGEQFSTIVNSTSSGLSPLHYALLQKNPKSEIIAMLLEAGADPNHAVETDISYSRADIMLTLYDGWTPMHIAVQCYCRTDILKLLYAAKGDFFKADKKGWKPADLVFHNTSIPAVGFLFREVIEKDQLPTKRFINKRSAESSEFLRRNFGNQIKFNDCGDYFTLSWNTPRQKRARRH